jgi:hypothetical protein
MNYNQPVTIVSLKVNSLNSGRLGRYKHQEINNLVRHTFPRSDVLLLQDHRLDEDNYLTLTTSLLHKNDWAF